MHAETPSRHPHDPAKLAEAAQRWLGRGVDSLSEAERRVLGLFLQRHALGSAREGIAAPTFGERIADKVAKFGGSWTFIGLFGLVLVAWVVANSLWLRHPFDVYPFVFLNLLLSMLAAVQAPVIMMSQNRQAAKDRSDAAHDYEEGRDRDHGPPRQARRAPHPADRGADRQAAGADRTVDAAAPHPREADVRRCNRPMWRIAAGRWSERRDSNPRPLDPQSSALPDCATLRRLAARRFF